MGKDLSKELQKYYTRKGNRIIFANGMTLNQLAWEMWERLGCFGVDPSVLSRVVNGTRVFTRNQLEIFCKLLNSSKKNRNRLFNAFYADLEERMGTNLFEEGTSLSIDYLDSRLTSLGRDMRRIPFDITDSIIKELLEVIRDKILLTSDIRKLKTLYLLLGDAIEILIWCKPPITTNWFNKGKEVDKISHDLKYVSQVTDDGYYHELANMNYNQYYQFTNRYELTIQTVEKTNFDVLKDVEWQADGYEAILNSYALMGKRHEFSMVQKRLINEIINFNSDFKAKIFQGIAYGDTLLGNIFSGRKCLDKSWMYAQENYTKGCYYLARKIELLRTEIVLGKYFNTSHGELDKYAKEGREVSSIIGHKKYESFFDNYLQGKVVV